MRTRFVLALLCASFLAACGGGSPPALPMVPGTPDPDDDTPVAARILVANLMADVGSESVFGNVTAYRLDATGNAAPTQTVGGAANSGINEPSGLAYDAVNDEIIVSNDDSESVTVFAGNATGDIIPSRTISGGMTGLTGPEGVAVDSGRNEITVVNIDIGGSSIRTFTRTADGNVAPLRVISGEMTGLSTPGAIAIDEANDEFFVADGMAILVFGQTATGNVAPVRTLNAVALASPPTSVSVDAVNEELIVAAGAVRVFALDAEGLDTPLRSLFGDDSPFFALNAAVVHGNELFVCGADNMSGNYAIRVFSRTASGTDSPLRTIQGASTGLDFPVDIAIKP